MTSSQFRRERLGVGKLRLLENMTLNDKNY
jgi:hypothetical protein